MKKDYAHSRSYKDQKKESRSDFSSEQRLKKENEKLKRQISQLKKIISRIDIDQYKNLKEVIGKHESEDIRDQEIKDQQKQQDAWKCYDCIDGILRLRFFENRLGMKYYRQCDNCSKRTKAKNYHKDVKGIK